MKQISTFQIPSEADQCNEYKRLYTIKTNRFKQNFIPRSCSSYSAELACVVVAVDKELNLSILPIKTEGTPTFKTFTFEDSIVSISTCFQNSQEYFLLVTTKKDSYVIDSIHVITQIEISPISIGVIYFDNKELLLIAGNSDGSIFQESISNPNQIRQFNSSFDSGVDQIQISSTKTFVACSYMNGSLSILESSGLNCIWKCSFSYGLIQAFGWNKNDTFLAFAGQNDNFYVINLRNDYEITPFEGHNSFVTSISFDPYQHSNDFIIFTTAEDATLGLWNISLKNNFHIGLNKSSFIGPFNDPLRYVESMKYCIITVDTNGTISLWRRVKPK